MPNFPFRLTLALALLCTGAAAEEAPVEIEAPSAQAPRDDTIHECVGADGSRVYSDEPCVSKEAKRAENARASAESLDAADDWICAADGGAGYGTLEEARFSDLPLAQRNALASADFGRLRGNAVTRLGPLGSAHVCIGAREVKVDPAGRVLVKRGGVVRYVNDPATPAALQLRCQDLLERCGGLDPGATLGACIDETPACEATPPWNDPKACCPKTCVSAFRNATRANMEAKDAARAVFSGKSCL